MKRISKFTREELLNLLLVCALPIHFWAVIILLHEFSWYLEKRNFIYFLGVSGYSLGFAILESFLFFGFIFLLTLLFPKSWKNSTPIAVASTMALVIAFWGILNQVILLVGLPYPAFFEWVMLRAYHRQNLFYSLLWIVLMASAAFPVLALPRWENGQRGVITIVERLKALVPIYIFLDLIGIVSSFFRVTAYWV